MVDTKLAVCHSDVSVGMKSLASVAEMDWEGFFYGARRGGEGEKNYEAGRGQSLFSLVIFFQHGLPELERFHSVTFVLPRHCPADLTIFAGQGRKGVPWCKAGRPFLKATHPAHKCSFPKTHTRWVTESHGLFRI